MNRAVDGAGQGVNVMMMQTRALSMLVSIALGTSLAIACSSSSTNPSDHASGGTSTGGSDASAGGSGGAPKGGTGGIAKGGSAGIPSGGTAGTTPDASSGGSGGGTAGAGACGGKDCLGGACINNQCDAVLLASTADSAALVAPIDIAVDQSFVYFTANAYLPGKGSVMRASIDGGQVTILASGLDFPYSIALDATYVYWTSGFDAADAGPTGSVMRILKTASSGTPDVLASGETIPTGISLDDQYVYWVNHTNPGSVKRTLKDGTGTTEILDSGQNKPRATWADPGAGTNGNVYYTVQESGFVRRIQKGTTGAATVSDAHPGIRPIVVDQSEVFFGVSLAPGSLFEVPASGIAQPATQVSSGNFSAVIDLAVDASYLYFTTQRLASPGCVSCVMRVPRSGGAAQLVYKLNALNPNPSGIALDAKAVYWVEYDEAQVYKIAK